MKIYVINRFLLCGFIGWSMECFWTGLCSIINQEDALLPCKTSVWMFPIYGFAMFIGPLSKRLRNKHWLIRGIIYALCIFFIEFCSGIILDYYHVRPWNYSHVKYQLKGVIRLDYTPLWFCVGLLFEQILKECRRWSSLRIMFKHTN